MAGKALISVPLSAPSKGAFPDMALRSIPPDGAAVLRNIRVEGGLARQRSGSTTLYTAPNVDSVLRLCNLIFNDNTVRSLRITGAVGVAGATSSVHYDTGIAWNPVTLATAFTTAAGDWFWACVSPWGASSVGQIVASNFRQIKTWDGNPANPMTAVLGGFPSRVGFVGPDGRLFLGHVQDLGVQQQEVVWSVPGLPAGNATDWNGAVAGSGALRLRGDSWPITAGWVQYGRVFIGKSRSIVALDPTGIATYAYGSSPVVTNGRGVYAPLSLIQWGDLVAFLAADGFCIFDGTNVTPVGGPSPRSLMRRLNANALHAVTSLYIEDEGKILWGLPMDGSTTPNEVWVFDTKTGGWAMDSLPHTALSLYMNVDVTYIAELVGFIGALAGTIASLSASISPKTEVAYGTTAGATYKLSSSATTDAGLQIVGSYTSPVIKPVGAEVVIAGKRRLVAESDYLVLDEVVLTLLDLGYTYYLKVEVSRDGGTNWVTLGTVGLTTAGGTDLAPRVEERRLAKRYGLGQQCQLRLSNMTGSVLWGWEEIRLNLDVVGQTRPEATIGVLVPEEPEP
jgi:hypothetical protein